MNKADLIEVVMKETELKKKDAAAAVDAVFAGIEKALCEGDKVQIVGFGAFETKVQAAREGRNPATGEAIQIPESKTVKFSAGKALKEKVNG
ncbi:MAG: HU family DNA-binding protein [Clostridia bacterium]|nr:HU family DNA-binding protein [Clostridia bacterium]